MALRRMWDAAWPPEAPPRVAAVAGYIGGSTPHIWSDAEWAASMQKSGARYKLPIFVRVPPTTRDPRVEARFCVDWAKGHGQPKGTLIALDYETAVDAAYLEAFDQTIVAGGYQCIVYGSRSFVMQNPRPSGGYWTATWDNVPHLDPGADITQYGGDVTLGQPWDINVVADNAPLWDAKEGLMLDAADKDWFVKQFTQGAEGVTVRTAIWELAVRAVNSTLGSGTSRGAIDQVAIGDGSPARKGIADVVGGLPVELDVTKLTLDQLTLIGSVMGGKVVVTGVQAKDGKLTLELEAT